MFRFSIRELLLVTLVLAMGLGWLAHWQVMERRYARRSDYIRKLKDELGYRIGESNAVREAFRWKKQDITFMRSPLPPELENEP